MTPLIPILGCIVLLASCSTHYHQIHDDTLTLYLDKPDAKQVLLACSYDDFEPRETRNVNKKWVISFPARPEFRYFYLVDGEIYIPSCNLKENDDFGSENCIFVSDM